MRYKEIAKISNDYPSFNNPDKIMLLVLASKINEIIEALNAEKLEPRIDRSCGCVKCICEDEERCHGCGSHECQYHQDIRLERDKLKESGLNAEKAERCPRCKGSGLLQLNPGNPNTCPDCSGTGKAERCPECSGSRTEWFNGQLVTCSACNGTGQSDKGICPQCKGKLSTSRMEK